MPGLAVGTHLHAVIAGLIDVAKLSLPEVQDDSGLAIHIHMKRCELRPGIRGRLVQEQMIRSPVSAVG